MGYKQIKDTMQAQMKSVQEKANTFQERLYEKGDRKNEQLKQRLINDMPGGVLVDVDFRPHQKDYINQVRYFDGKTKYNLKLSWVLMNWSVEITNCEGDTIGCVKKAIVKNPLRHLTEFGPKTFELIERGAHKGKLDYLEGSAEALRRGYRLHYKDWKLTEGKKMNEIYIKDGNNELLCNIVSGRNSHVFLGVKNAADEVMALLIIIAMMATELTIWD